LIGREKIFINASKPYISFVGDGQEKTIIQWGDKAGDFDDEDQLLKTYKSATVGVNSQYFIAENIQFRVKQNIFLDYIFLIIIIIIFGGGRLFGVFFFGGPWE
jgi:hypothetical protein